MNNHRNNGTVCGLCGGTRTGRRTGMHGTQQDPLWSGYGTYPRQSRQGQGNGNYVSNSRSQARTGCPSRVRAEQHGQNGGCGCGCGGSGSCNGNGNGHGGHEHNDCQKLLQQIRTVDFALYEVILYLDVYPTSCEALDTYHKLLVRRKALYEEYETNCGPITATGNESHTAWDWIDKPFPWETSAN